MFLLGLKRQAVGTCGFGILEFWGPSRNFDASQLAFEELRRRDPYRLSLPDWFCDDVIVILPGGNLQNLCRRCFFGSLEVQRFNRSM